MAPTLLAVLIVVLVAAMFAGVLVMASVIPVMDESNAAQLGIGGLMVFFSGLWLSML